MCVNRNPWAGYRMGLSLIHHVSSNPESWGLKSLPFKLQPKRLEIDERARWIRLWSDALNNRTALVKAPNEWTQIKHIMHSRRAARSPLWWWRCLNMAKWTTNQLSTIATSVVTSVTTKYSTTWQKLVITHNSKQLFRLFLYFNLGGKKCSLSTWRRLWLFVPKNKTNKQETLFLCSCRMCKSEVWKTFQRCASPEDFMRTGRHRKHV